MTRRSGHPHSAPELHYGLGTMCAGDGRGSASRRLQGFMTARDDPGAGRDGVDRHQRDRRAAIQWSAGALLSRKLRETGSAFRSRSRLGRTLVEHLGRDGSHPDGREGVGCEPRATDADDRRERDRAVGPGYRHDRRRQWLRPPRRNRRENPRRRWRGARAPIRQHAGARGSDGGGAVVRRGDAPH